jgi:hypothetical protein
MKGSGGTEGGTGLFLTGFALAAASAWFFFDSVRVTTGAHGFFSGLLHEQLRGPSGSSSMETGSMGLVFMPFFLGVLALFYNSKPWWAWTLMYTGLGVITVEILSRVRFLLNMKSSHLLLLMAVFAAGAGMMIRSYRDYSKEIS